MSKRTIAVVTMFVMLAVLTSGTSGRQARAQQQPAITHVYTYNNEYVGTGAGEWFNISCKYWVWRQMGFTKATTGRPGAIVNNDVMLDKAVVGSVVAAGRLRSADGRREAFDLSQTTFAAAYQAAGASANSTLTVCAHGGQHQIQGHQGGAKHRGGTIWLDGNTRYAGFGAGTGVPPALGAPYPALPGTTQDVNVDLHVCYSERDPDGAAKPEISVLQSLLLQGGGSLRLTGRLDEARSIRSYEIDGGTNAQKQAALNALAAFRKPLSFGAAYYDGLNGRIPANLRQKGLRLVFRVFIVNAAGGRAGAPAGAEPDEPSIEDTDTGCDSCSADGCGEPPSVGGIFRDSGANAAPLEAQPSSSSDAWLLAELIAGTAAAALTIGGGAWYVRRRRVR